MEAEHNVFDENGEILICFANSSWYDTATPAQWCANRLTELNDKIKTGKKLKIVSNNVEIEIVNSTDYKNWLKMYFKGGFETMFDRE